MTEIQKLWALSVINGTDNFQRLLPEQKIQWPRETWFQTRLEQIRKEQSHENKLA